MSLHLAPFVHSCGRAFSSIFLELPHRTTRNYKALLQKIGEDIFHSDHCLEPYYVSAYANYRMDYFFRNQTLSSDLKPARYHLLLAFRLLTEPSSLPRYMSSHDMVKYCEAIMDILWDNERCKTAFSKAGDLIRKTAGGNMQGDNVRTEAFTKSLLT